jgi:hypothetical protein
VPRIDLVVEHFIVADRSAIRLALCDRARWQEWLPTLHLEVQEDRGLKGVRWLVSGAERGTAEVWIKEYADGAVVHVFLRLQVRSRRRLSRAYGVPLQRQLFAAKDSLEAGRAPGERRKIVSDAPTGIRGPRRSETWPSRPRPASASPPTRRV